MRNIRDKKQEKGRFRGRRANIGMNVALYRELQKYQEEGIRLWLNGRPSTSYQIANRVREEENYMRDYQMDCQNQICGIGFDRIRKDKKQNGEVPLMRKLK
ncbi:MAG: hypothetical protein Q4C50_07430 [Eubacteriales bacterium]|nr:hypothetical protein [Eubacteriales bacterium]